MSRDVSRPAFKEKSGSMSNLFSQKVERAEISHVGGRIDDSEIHVDDLGPIRIVRLASGAITIRRGVGDINGGAEPCFTFLLQVSGAAQFQQYGNQVRLQPGDISLCDNSAPYSYGSDEACEVLMLRVRTASCAKPAEPA